LVHIPHDEAGTKVLGVLCYWIKEGMIASIPKRVRYFIYICMQNNEGYINEK
jgi:hypothetical protein